MNSQCDLCGATQDLELFKVTPASNLGNDEITLCATCRSQIEDSDTTDANHWRCLNDSMWSQDAAVQVMAWRQLTYLAKSESWAQDLLDMLYMEDDVLQWAKSGIVQESEKTLDVNGHELKAGDSVTLVKDLVVKGANFTAKRGTPVRNIGLTNNPEHIQGRVNGTMIVIIAAYCKKN